MSTDLWFEGAALTLLLVGLTTLVAVRRCGGKPIQESVPHEEVMRALRKDRIYTILSWICLILALMIWIINALLIN